MAHVIIVDDDLAYLDALAEGLTVLGYEVTTAASAAEALTLLEQLQVDIAIVDMIMEGGGAISLVHDLRARGHIFPIIVATGRPQIADSPVFRKGLREAAARIQKTTSLSEIDTLIRNCLKG